MPSSPGTPGKADKGMSSRLLTMKFMQRAAASAASKESDSASSGPISKEKAHNSKRLRPSTDNSAQNELDTIAAALAAEEEKRREVIARQAAEAGESQWVLNIPAAAPRAQPYVMAADSLDADDDNNGGRRGFGNFKRKQTISSPANNDSDDDEEAANGSAHQARSQGSKGAKFSKLNSISAGGNRSKSMGAPPQKKKKRKSGQSH